MRTANRVTVASLAWAAIVLSSCGDASSTPTPQVQAALHEVDTAVAERNYPEAVDALKTLKAAVNEAHESGDLSDQHATDILTAAAQLMIDVRARNNASTEGTPTPTDDTAPAGEGDSDSEGHHDKHDDTGKPDKEGEPGNSENAPGHQDD